MSSRSRSIDVADVFVKMNRIFDGIGARESVEVVRVEDVMMTRLRLGWQSRWRDAGRSAL